MSLRADQIQPRQDSLDSRVDGKKLGLLWMRTVLQKFRNRGMASILRNNWRVCAGGVNGSLYMLHHSRDSEIVE
jgi:hypothetical protein